VSEGASGEPRRRFTWELVFWETPSGTTPSPVGRGGYDAVSVESKKVTKMLQKNLVSAPVVMYPF